MSGDGSSSNARKAGFLQNNERVFLAEQGYYPVEYPADVESGGRQAKHRIKNEIATPVALSQQLQHFQCDLMAIWNLYRRESRDSLIEWRQQILPANKHELVELRDLLNRMIEVAESDDLETEEKELREALLEIGGDLFGGGLQESPMELDELLERQQALALVIEKKGTAEILEHIGENEPCQLSSEKKAEDDGWRWTRVANEYLVPELVQEIEKYSGGSQYQLTDVGRDILEVWKALEATTTVEQQRNATPDMTDRQCVRNALEFHGLLDKLNANGLADYEGELDSEGDISSGVFEHVPGDEDPG